MCLNLENSRDDQHWFTRYDKHLFPCSKHHICIIVVQNSHSVDSRLPELLGTPGSSAVEDSRSWLFGLLTPAYRGTLWLHVWKLYFIWSVLNTLRTFSTAP